MPTDPLAPHPHQAADTWTRASERAHTPSQAGSKRAVRANAGNGRDWGELAPGVFTASTDAGSRRKKGLGGSPNPLIYWWAVRDSNPEPTD